MAKNTFVIEKVAFVESKCKKHDINITQNRRAVIAVMCETLEHLNVEEIYNRVSSGNKDISLATVYRTISLLENHKIIKRLEIGDNKAMYEINTEETNHYHLIDNNTGEIIEFSDKEFEILKTKIGKKLKYKITDCKFELYGEKIK